MKIVDGERAAVTASAIEEPRRAANAPGLLLLSISLLFNVLFLAPELRIERVPLNDVVFHLAGS